MCTQAHTKIKRNEERKKNPNRKSFDPGTHSAKFHSTCHMYLQQEPRKQCDAEAREDRCEVRFPAGLTQPFILPSQTNCILCSLLCGVFRKRPWKTSCFLLSLLITEIVELFVSLCPKPTTSLQAGVCQGLKDHILIDLLPVGTTERFDQ